MCREDCLILSLHHFNEHKGERENLKERIFRTTKFNFYSFEVVFAAFFVTFRLIVITAL